MSWKSFDTEGVRRLESSLDELAEALDGDWTTGDRFDIHRYRELREQGVGEPTFKQQTRSGHWKDSGLTKDLAAQSALMTDSFARKGIKQVLLIALRDVDIENLETVAAVHRNRNYGVIVRDLLVQEAARAQ